MNLDIQLKFNFNKRNRYKNICSIEGCNNRACGKYCNKHYHQIKRYGHIKTRTRFDKNEIIINDNVAKILLYDNNCNVIDYTIIDAEDINKISKYKISKCGNYAYAKAIYKYRTNTGKMTASDYTHLFGYLNPYYRSAYNIPKRRK